MPAIAHICPKCSYENPCFFSEGDIVALKDEVVNTPWTGMVLEVERDPSGRVYRVLWGPPPTTAGVPAVTERHSGAHRGEELQRFLVPLMAPPGDLRVGGGGGREGVPRGWAPPGG